MNTLAVVTPAPDVAPPDEVRRPSRPSIVRGVRRAGAWLRTSLGSTRSSAADVHGSVFNRTIELDDDELKSAFDSPLQTSMHLLTELRGKLDRVRMRGGARTVDQVMQLLKSPDLHNSKSMDELIDDGKVKADESIKNWLEAMEWVRKDKERNSDGVVGQSSRSSVQRGSSRLSKYSTTELLDAENSTVLDAVDETEDSNSARRLILPRVAKGLSTDAETRILFLFEHGIAEWEFDMFELDTLSGGHPVQALVRAHCVRIPAGAPDPCAERERMLTAGGVWRADAGRDGRSPSATGCALHSILAPISCRRFCSGSRKATATCPTITHRTPRV